MTRVARAVVVLVAALAGCGVPQGAWSWRSPAEPRAGYVLFFVVHRDTLASMELPEDDSAYDQLENLDALEEADEFDELDQELAEQMIEVADPLEGWNRAMFQLNDGLYFYVGKPILQAYAAVTPEEARIAIRHFFDNLGMPARAINCLLQGRWDDAGIELRRFGINTTVGILGFTDVARTDYGLEPVRADMGQTLAVYGLGDGWYLVWPVFGPSTVKDSVGFVADQFMNPVRYVPPLAVSLGISTFRVTNDGSLRLGEYEALTSDALDPYVAVRQAYIQYRRQRVPPPEPTPEEEAVEPDAVAGAIESAW